VSPDEELRGRRCLITGAAGGIGEAAARLLCKDGAQVVVTDLDTTQLEALATDLTADGHIAHPLALDVTSESDVVAVIGQAARLMGGIDTLIANAGILTLDAIDDITLDAFRRTIEVNLIGTFLCARGHSFPSRSWWWVDRLYRLASRNRGRAQGNVVLCVEVRRRRHRAVACA